MCHSLPLLGYKKVKKGCCAFTVHPDGGVTGYKYPPGFYVKSTAKSLCNNVFLSCTNASRAFRWGIGFATLDRWIEGVLRKRVRG